ncbi:putative 1,4-benzoquinone reductase [Cladorrhinum sp. PSN332]|nr:putative 1,4-benzoquinone reductase [Cladorrhinum sp. PSN332]
MAPKIAIVYYSMYGHIRQLADAEKAGIERAGGTADLYQVEETLPAEVLTKMHAPPKPTDIPVLSDPTVLKDYDGILFGIPTRYGNFPAQWKAFWDKTGGIWQSGGYWGKHAGVFISTASQGGGQESTALAAMSTFAHHGLIYVPLGYAKAFGILTDLSAVRGGSAWGAGTFAGADGSRQPSDAEKELATIQGEEFYKIVAKATGFGKGGSGGDVPAQEAAPATAAAPTSAPAVEEAKREEPVPQKKVKEVKLFGCEVRLVVQGIPNVGNDQNNHRNHSSVLDVSKFSK